MLALQDKDSAWDIEWMGDVTYRDMMFNEEVEHSRYYFDVADVDALKNVYDTYEREVGRALEGDATISAYDYVLKCSHLFNVLDTRGAIGVTERAKYFRSMRDMTRSVAQSYSEKREELGSSLHEDDGANGVCHCHNSSPKHPKHRKKRALSFLKLGLKNCPADDVDDALGQMRKLVPAMFKDLRLNYKKLHHFRHTTPPCHPCGKS